jgi:hypothetical protein
MQNKQTIKIMSPRTPSTDKKLEHWRLLLAFDLTSTWDFSCSETARRRKNLKGAVALDGDFRLFGWISNFLKNLKLTSIAFQ